MHRGETSINRALFIQKVRKYFLLHLQRLCHTTIQLNINILKNNARSPDTIYR
jgi:hypothetical protein